MHVLDNGGTVRGFRYWGTLTLPQRMRRQKEYFNYGEYVPSFLPPTDLSAHCGNTRAKPYRRWLTIPYFNQLLVHAL